MSYKITLLLYNYTISYNHGFCKNIFLLQDVDGIINSMHDF